MRIDDSQIRRSRAPQRGRETSHSRQARPPEPRDEYRANEQVEPDIRRFQQMGRAFQGAGPLRPRILASPERTRAQQAMEPRPESPEAQQVRGEFRQAWNEADQAWHQAQQARERGLGQRTLPDGSTENVVTLPNGATEVTTRGADGRSRSVRYDESGRVYVQNRDAEGKLTDSLYRFGSQVSRNITSDFHGTPPQVTYGAFPDGSMFRASTDATQVIVNPNGQMFDPMGGLKPPPRDPGGPARAEANSEIPALRQAMEKYGLTGKGVTVGVLDDYDEFLGRVGGHGEAVGGVVNDPRRGVAPGARVTPMSEVPGGTGGSSGPSFPADLPDDPQALEKALLEGTNPRLGQLNERLQSLLDDPHRDPSLRVLNLSLGTTRAAYYGNVWNLLNQRGEDGQYRYPKLRDKVLGAELAQKQNLELTEDVAKAIASYADPHLQNPNSAYQRDIKRFGDTARQLSEKGITTVVAAGNEGDQVWDRVSPGSTFNDLARNEHVIGVGATDTHQAPGPGNRHLHTPWDRSAPGDDRDGPLVLAPGHEQYTHGDNYGSGTSSAAPFVAGTIALMLEANPNLTTAEIRAILQESAFRLPGVEGRAQGAGVLQPEEAVRLALERRRK